MRAKISYTRPAIRKLSLLTQTATGSKLAPGHFPFGSGDPARDTATDLSEDQTQHGRAISGLETLDGATHNSLGHE